MPTSPSTPTAPTTSSSTRAATPKTPLLRKTVHRRSPVQTLTAVQQVERIDIVVGGRDMQAFPLDWVIYSGDRIVDVVSPAQLEKIYETNAPQGLQIAESDLVLLAAAIGPTSVGSSKDLTRAVQRLARLKVGDIEVNFSPAQWEELARRAEKRRIALPEYMARLVEKITQDIWTLAD